MIKGVSEKAAERAVGAPMQRPKIIEAVPTAEGARCPVVDFPPILALLSVVRPDKQIPVVVDAVNGGREAVERATRRPSGDLLLFKPRESG